MSRNWIEEPDMDPHTESIDEFVAGFPPVLVRDVLASFSTEPIRHRRRSTVRGFFMHPLVSLGIITVCAAVFVAVLWRWVA